MNKLLPLIVPMLLSSCTAITPQGTLTLVQGQTGTLGGKTITLLKVADSRCRPNVQCIWAGELTATVKVNDQTLTLKWPQAEDAPWQGLRIKAATWDQPAKVTFTDQKDRG